MAVAQKQEKEPIDHTSITHLTTCLIHNNHRIPLHRYSTLWCKPTVSEISIVGVLVVKYHSTWFNSPDGIQILVGKRTLIYAWDCHAINDHNLMWELYQVANSLTSRLGDHTTCAKGQIYIPIVCYTRLMVLDYHDSRRTGTYLYGKETSPRR